MVQITEVSGPEKTAQLLAELHKRGISYQTIATRLGVSWRTVYRWSRMEHPPITTTMTNAALGQILAEEIAR